MATREEQRRRRSEAAQWARSTTARTAREATELARQTGDHSRARMVHELAAEAARLRGLTRQAEQHRAKAAYHAARAAVAPRPARSAAQPAARSAAAPQRVAPTRTDREVAYEHSAHARAASSAAAADDPAAHQRAQRVHEEAARAHEAAGHLATAAAHRAQAAAHGRAHDRAVARRQPPPIPDMTAHARAVRATPPPVPASARRAPPTASAATSRPRVEVRGATITAPHALAVQQAQHRARATPPPVPVQRGTRGGAFVVTASGQKRYVRSAA